MHALIVDDDPHMASIASLWLLEAGYSVTISYGLLEGVHHFQQDRPDTVVVDVRLGDFNGVQLAILARERDPNVRIVVMSAWDDPVLQRDAAQCGASYLVKPFNASQLLTAIAHPTMPAAHVSTCERTEPLYELVSADRHRVVGPPQTRREPTPRADWGLAAIAPCRTVSRNSTFANGVPSPIGRTLASSPSRAKHSIHSSVVRK